MAAAVPASWELTERSRDGCRHHHYVSSYWQAALTDLRHILDYSLRGGSERILEQDYDAAVRFGHCDFSL